MNGWREWLWWLDEWAMGTAMIAIGVSVLCVIASQAIQLALRWCRW